VCGSQEGHCEKRCEIQGGGQTKKTRKKNEETKPIFESSYLTNAWGDLVEI